jgi:O-antigen biosynthesis protein WbqV
MGQPVKITELAQRMIRLAGLEPERDIEIMFTGVRPGERLTEYLFAHDESHSETSIPGIVAAKPVSADINTITDWLATIEKGLVLEDRALIYGVLRTAVPDFRGDSV